MTNRTVSMTTAEAATAALLTHGVTQIYGLPGTHNDDLFDAFYQVRDRLRFVHARHEQAGAFMALGASLVTGKPQVFSVVPGPGLLNAGAAILTAQAMNAPIVGLVGQIPQREIDRGHGYLHEIRDQLGLARHIAKFAARIDSAADAPRLVAAAFAEAQRGRPGPVILECGMDVWGRKGAVAQLDAPLSIEAPPVDADAVARATEILSKAKHPIVVVGGGAQGASAEVTALAEALEAPVIAYRRGQGVVSARHRLSVNLPVGHRLWKDADAVLAIGTRLLIQQTQWGTDANLPIVRIDIDPEEPARLNSPAVAIVADARDAAAALLRALPAHNIKRAPADLAAHRAWLAERLSRLEPQASYLRALRNALPENGIFVDEVTQLGFASRLAFPVYAPRTYFSPGYQDALGWGYGTALGVKAARPDLPVLAISGDGGFLYQATELATAMHHDIAVVVVVFDNSAFGNVRLLQKERFGGRLIADSLTNPDFVKFAESFGANAYRATTAPVLERAVKDAFAAGRPALIHVPCGEMPSPWDMIMMPQVRG